MSEASGGLEETPCVRGQGRLGGATPCQRPVVAGRRHPASEVRVGWEKPPRARGQGRQLGGATHVLGQDQRPGGATRGVVAKQAQEGLEELSQVEGQEWWQ